MILNKPSHLLSERTSLWSMPLEDLLRALETSEAGLSTQEALARLKRVGPNTVAQRAHLGPLLTLLRQFASPFILILIAVAGLSFALHEPTDGTIILSIVFVSSVLSFWQEHAANASVKKLLKTVELKATALRDGNPSSIPTQELVPGDVILLAPGSSIPADCRLLAAQDLFVDEAVLTGESYPVHKTPGIKPPDTPIGQRDNVLFQGTHVVSGTGKAVVVFTGRATEFGRIFLALQMKAPETEFERGVRRFGYLLLEVTLILVLLIFALNVYLQRPVLDSFLFSLALAVGLTPQLLPAIISVNLAKGAREMAKQKVIVKRLASIENFGSMDVLCTDKTGTLTEGRVRVYKAIAPDGKESERVLFCAYLNASYQAAFTNPVDQAIRASQSFSLEGWRKLGEVPYDFERKRLSVLVEHQGQVFLVTKGAVHKVLEVCVKAQLTDGSERPLATVLDTINQLYAELSAQGYRTLGIAVREWDRNKAVDRASETDMTFLGLLALTDPLKPGITAVIESLRKLGVRLKIITGDNALVAARVGAEVGLSGAKVLTGPELDAMSDEALQVRAQETDIFAEVDPHQKGRIIRALRKAGHVVGFMGDGINDAPALHAADVSISVQEAVDVAKEAADIVLLERDLSVLAMGIREGRRTFANTLKYVFMATSANFGNMFSMAGASIFLPFLPLLPKQILLTNFLTDLPEMTIATDRVDASWIEQPKRWDVRLIRSFMIVFGPLSSLFDYVTFGVLLWGLRAGTAEFRTGWFVESVVSAATVVLVLRTRGPFWRNTPAPLLVIATALATGMAVLLPFTPLARPLGFVSLPLSFFLVLTGILIAYVAAAEAAKSLFYRTVDKLRVPGARSSQEHT